ncbi:acyl-CoA dehydrogenase family protein [Hydrogenophaga sp.]|uniref:acyl-CoA dehydrogenase family protein n=1 Tax=Hydrogenophaga sp. TaxID=1904254 RepID=UPI00391C589D
MREILEESIQRLLSDQVSPALLRESEAPTWCGDLWSLIEESGFPLALVSETNGGADLRWADVAGVAMATGFHVLPLPLVEGMLAAHLIDRAGLALPEGPLTVADSLCAQGLKLQAQAEGWCLSGRVSCVPWGRWSHFLVLDAPWEGQVHTVVVDVRGASFSHDLNLAREPRDAISLEGLPVVAAAPCEGLPTRHPVRLFGALLRSAQMAGTMERLSQQSVQYATERVQFGKAIGKFQAIQQQLAVLGCEAAATAAAALFAFEQADGPGAAMAVAAAKVRASEAAGQVAAIAHATHGAIGFTYEHTLHFASRRLWSWRSELGHQAWWSDRLGAAVCASDVPFWHAVTAGELAGLAEQLDERKETV